MKTFFRLCAAFGLFSFSVQLHAQCGLPWACNYDPGIPLTFVSACDINDCIAPEACNYTPGCAGDTGNHCAYDSVDGYCVEGNDAYGFQGIYTPSFDYGVGNGSVVTTSSSVTVIGSDGSGETPDPAFGFYHAVRFDIQATGDYSFKWEYTTMDAPNFDSPSYFVNSLQTPLWTTLDNNQSGSVTVSLTQGDVLVFWMDSTDDLFGAGVLTIHEFTAPLPVEGCTQPFACNYAPLANVNDGSCILPSGCDDPLATNFNPMTSCSDLCLYDLACGEVGNPDLQRKAGFDGDFAPSNWNVIVNDYSGQVPTPLYQDEEQIVMIVRSGDGFFGEMAASVTVTETGWYLFPIRWQYGGDGGNFNLRINGELRHAIYDIDPQDPIDRMLHLYLEAGDDVWFYGNSTGDSANPTALTTASLVIGKPVYTSTDFCQAGCTYPDASNYNPDAGQEDGSCVFIPIENPCPADVTANGEVDTSDLLSVLGSFGSVCP